MSKHPSLRREASLRFLAQPTDINLGGNVHGGIVMKWIDEAAYVCAAGWCSCTCVTVYVGGIRFYKPVHIGDVVDVSARLIYTGTTSMHIAVDVSTRDPRHQEWTQTTHCIIVYVAIDDDGKPVPVPAWEPKTKEDTALRDYAVRLMNLRKGVEEEMQPYISAAGK
jgi:acyl-CoA hydrolase